MKRDYKWCSVCRETTVKRKTENGWLCDKCHPEIKEVDASLSSESGAEAQT